jgi:hypothetical protein
MSSPTRISTGRASLQRTKQSRIRPSPHPTSRTDLGSSSLSDSRRNSCLCRTRAGLKLMEGGEACMYVELDGKEQITWNVRGGHADQSDRGSSRGRIQNRHRHSFG